MELEHLPGDGERPEGGKLVRDRIPALLRSKGLDLTIAVLDQAAYRQALRRKLVEEAQEAAAADEAALLDELADLYELIVTVAALNGASLQDVAAAAERKRAERGGFQQRLWLAATPLRGE